MSTGTQSIDAGGARRLEVCEGGDPNGLPILIHHGTPGGAGVAEGWQEDALRRGLRLITFSRAGYGGSSRAPERSVGQVIQDSTAVLDHLKVGRFATWGASGGGPHALACAALMSDRVVAASCLSGFAPYDAEGLDWFDGMGQSNVKEFQAALSGDSAEYLAVMGHEVAEMKAASLEDFIEGISSLLSTEDLSLMRTELGAFMHRSIVESLGNSAYGLVDDDIAFTRPWGFDVAEIRVPIQVWQGNQDLMVPFNHGKWLAARIPGADAHLVPEFGHMTPLARHLPEIHQWLAVHFLA